MQLFTDEKQENLEHMVGSDSRAQNLEKVRRERLENLKKAEDTERKYFSGEDSIADLWNHAMRDVVSAYNHTKAMSTSRKATYNLLGKMGIDMYSREANRILNRAQEKADTIKTKLHVIDEKLYKRNGRGKGLAVQLEQEKELAVTHANALASSKRMKDEYRVEISKKRQELAELRQLQHENADKDYSGDIEYIGNEVENLEKEYKGLSDDMRRLSNKLHVYDAKIKTKEAIVSSISMVYSKGEHAYLDLMSSIEIAREFVNNGNLVDEGLVKTVLELEDAVDVTTGLVGMEEIMGNALIESTRQIRQRTETIKGITRDKDYLKDLKLDSNDDEQEIRSSTEDLIEQYATVHYK
jgi:hypothetical protein